MSNNNHLIIAEQEAILNCSNKNLIVSASAGSGKTTVMIRKILNYILNGNCHIDELLVLTYTKSAAGEMKKKLMDKLKDSVDENPKLQEEIDMVLNADISTFDAFCKKLVKRFFYILNIDPSFTVLEGGQQNFQQGRAIDLAIKQLKQTNPYAYEVLINTFSSKRDETEIKNIILELYSYSTSLLELDNFFEKTKKLYKKDEKIAENYLNNYYFGIFTQIKNNLLSLQSISKNQEFTNYVEYINNLLSFIDKILLTKDFSSKIDCLNDIDYKVLRQDKNDEINLKNKINKEKTKLKLLVDKMKQTFISSECVNRSYEECSVVANSIIELLELFIQKYSFIKNKILAYDFDDIERMTIKLLENETINNEIKNSYKYIFVDEFQDANAIQEKIIFLLENNNLFFVGDTKQSIYAFRQSDPEIFLNIENRFSNNSQSEAKYLNCNFRTNKNILEFVNQIFNVIMTKKTAGINYKEKAQFDSKAVYKDLENEVCVSLNIINKPEKTEKHTPTEIYNVQAEQMQMKSNNFDDECLYVAHEIIKLLGTNIYDKDSQITKKIDFSDITILLAKRGAFLNALTKCFTEMGIPFVVATNDNLEEMFDNIILFNLIKLSQNTQDDYSLYSVITSALFNFTDNELALIKNEFPNTTSFHEAFKNYSSLNNSLSKKITNFYKILEEFSFNAKFKGLYYALGNIIVQTHYLLKISFEQDFANRKTCIEEYIDSFCGTQFDKDICEYIIYRETALRQEKLQPASSGLNSVNITTMHSSKGLEYPVVILPNLDSDFTKSPTTQPIKINKEFGFGIKSYHQEDRTMSNGIFYESCRLRNKEQEQSEKIRLLYVALTRAKNKLIMFGYNTKNFNNFTDDYDILSCNNYLSLIVNTLPKEILEKINNGENFKSNLFDNNKIELICTDVIEEMTAYNTTKQIINCDNQTIEQLASYLNMDLSIQQKPIALKNSVSGISNDEYSSINHAPQSFNISEHLSEITSDLGTLYHKVLEEINFLNVNSVSDVQQFIECNYLEQEISLLQDISYENIFKNITLIKGFLKNNKQFLKEQKFVMQVPYSEVTDSKESDKILVQGIIDLMIIKENEINLLDYKLSSKTNNQIKERYKKQLDLYELAIKKGFDGFQIKKYIVNLNRCEIIDMY